MKINNIKNQDSKLFQSFLDGVANLPPSNVEVIYEIKDFGRFLRGRLFQDDKFSRPFLLVRSDMQFVSEILQRFPILLSAEHFDEELPEITINTL